MTFPSHLIEAQKLIRISGTSHPPVRLSNIIGQCAGIKVSFDDIEGDGYLVDLGLLGTQVILKKKSPEVRQRFTLAHEIGHWILNKYQNSHAKIGDSLLIEEWCNRFAAELLMPSAWVRKYVLELTLNNFGELLKLPSKFSVSAEAFFRKVAESTPVSVFYVKKDAKGVKKIEQIKSEECPLSLLSYLKKYESMLMVNKIQGLAQVDSNVFCFSKLNYSKKNEREYVVFLVPSRNGLTIGFT